MKQFITYINIPETRGKIPKCQICSKNFGITTREHQCKRCLRAVCEACSPFKMTHIKKDGKKSDKPHRLCKICKEESDAIKSFVEQNQIAYGVDTLSKQWLGGSMNSQEYKNARESTKIRMEKTEISGLDNINYSLKEFYFLVGKDNTKLQNVCLTFCSKNPGIQFTAELVCLANFLLCFSSESSTYQLLGILFKQKPPDDAITNILTYCVKGFNLKDDDRSLMKQFLASRLSRYLVTYSINMFCFDTTVHLMTQQFNKFESFMKSLSAIFMLASSNLKSSTHEDLELWILRNVRRRDVENKIKEMQLPQKKPEPENREPSQSVRSLAYSIIDQGDQSQISDLRAEIVNLRLQLTLKDNEIESYKFQLAQVQSPDDQKKDKYIQQKNDEIAILLSRVDALTMENQQLMKKEASYQSQNAMFQDSQKLIQEQQRQIEKLKAKVKESTFENRAMSMSVVGGGAGIMSGKEVAELKEKHESEKQQLKDQISQLESSKAQLQRIVESQKQLNQRVVDYISSMTINTSPIELSVKPLERQTKKDNDDIKYIIDTKNQQNLLLKQLLSDNQQQIQNLNNKLKDIKQMIYSQ